MAKYLRTAGGTLDLIERTDGRSIESTVLGCWLRVVGVGHDARVRLSAIRDTTVLFPTAEEAERQAKEAERQAKEAALARIAELEARLARYEK